MPQSFRLPLLKDHHTHPMLYGAFSQSVSLLDAESQSEADELILAQAKGFPSAINVAHGWRSNRFDWSADELESLPPVAIFNVSLHGLKINRAGVGEMKRIYGDVVDNVFDQDWYEANFRTVLNWFAKLNSTKEALLNYFQRILKQGVYYAEEMLLIDEAEIEIFHETGLTDRTRFWAAPQTFDALSDSAKQSIHGLKLFADGALGARTAALTRPFIGNKELNQDELGILLHSTEALTQQVSYCLSTGKALAIHAIGDRAIEQVIDVLETFDEQAKSAPEVRIEHAQLITREMAKRAKRMGIVLSMQPNFSSDSVDYSDRLDSEYCALNNPFRMLIDDCGFEPGKDLIFGSDGMPHGIENALQQSLFPTQETQKLAIDEFKAGYCLDSLEPGFIDVVTEDSGEIRCAVHAEG